MDKELWNSLYNGTKISIEALEIIEINKRGKGPDKKIYTSIKDEDGPYYDPLALHVCILKKDSAINNFTCEQRSNVPHIQKRDYKSGLYCSVCHNRRSNFRFKWNEIKYSSNEPEKEFKETNYMKWKKITAKLRYSMIYKDSIFPWKKNNWRKMLPKLKYMMIKNNKEFPWNLTSNQKNAIINPVSKINWEKIIKKIEYTMNNEKIVYPISKYKSLLLWPWQMTPLQKMKLKIPDYKEQFSFIMKSNLDKFQDEYAIIV